MHCVDISRRSTLFFKDGLDICKHLQKRRKTFHTYAVLHLSCEEKKKSVFPTTIHT